MTTEELIELIPLDPKRYNRGRLAWEASVGAGYGTNLDIEVVEERFLEVSKALADAAEKL